MDNMITAQQGGAAPANGQQGGGGAGVTSTALVPMRYPPGAEVPESLSQFKVLSVEIIDRVWASLKQMVEEDTADLVRRQRQRDEKWRLLMKLRPSGGLNQQFANMHAGEVREQRGAG